MAAIRLVLRDKLEVMIISTYRIVVLTVVAIVLTCLSGLIAYQVALTNGLRLAEQMNQRRLQIFDRTLQANIERYHYLPSIIAQSPEIRSLLEHPEDDTLRAIANGYLSDLNGTANSDELFVVDMNGTSLTASNWWSHTSLVGGSYGQRPYFTDAVADGSAKYYAVGVTTGVPGYFLATRIDGPAGPLGVAVVKVNLGEIEAVWWRSGELIAIVDQNEVAILSTRPDWRYRSLHNLRPTQASALNDDQKYTGVTIPVKGIVDGLVDWRGTELALLRNSDREVSGEFIVERLRLPTHRWVLLSFTPLGPINSQAVSAALIVGFGVAAFLAALGLYEHRRRLILARLHDRDQLEERVRLRTLELQQANSRLNLEIEERHHAELEREQAQSSLVQAAKMASLGQALAGVAHEISQPLAALRTQLASAKKLADMDDPGLIGVLRGMEGVVSRISKLTEHLKTFSRKEVSLAITGDVVHIIRNALELTSHLQSSDRLTIDFEPPIHAVPVFGNPVHIEQVLINLISNAAHAMEDIDRPLVRIGIIENDADVQVTISDIGRGIDPAVANTLFDPFETTKDPGKGLGLGLSISYDLMRNMGGALVFKSIRSVGTTFIVTIPRFKSLEEDRGPYGKDHSLNS
jgi:C4-dicarboxylate-specific signal transduction histidine kinase